MNWIENCGAKWWKLWSVQLIALSTAISLFVTANFGNVVLIIQSVPVWLRVAMILGFGALKLVARLVHQPAVTADASQPTN